MGRTAVNSLLDYQNKMCYFDRLMVDFEQCKNSWFVLRRPYVVHGMLKSKNWETEENTKVLSENLKGVGMSNC